MREVSGKAHWADKFPLAFVTVVVFLAYKVGQNHLAEQPCFSVQLWLKDPLWGSRGWGEPLSPFLWLSAEEAWARGTAFRG